MNAAPGFEDLLAAIVKSDESALAALLQARPGLVAQPVARDRLYEEDSFVHWLYVGDTALHLAAAAHRPGIVGMLLAAGADPGAAGNRRCATPLHYAADGFVGAPRWDAAAQVQALSLLLVAGAPLHAADDNGATALHRAVRTRCADAVLCLLAAGADPARRNRAGSTSFHLAVQPTGRGGSGQAVALDGQRRIVEALLARGVDPMLTDGNGRTVLECARSGWLRAMLGGGAGGPS